MWFQHPPETWNEKTVIMPNQKLGLFLLIFVGVWDIAGKGLASYREKDKKDGNERQKRGMGFRSFHYLKTRMDRIVLAEEGLVMEMLGRGLLIIADLVLLGEVLAVS